MTDYKEVRTSQHEQGSEQRVATFRATQIIWLLLGLLEAVLALRFVFKLIAVNAANPFATLLYNVTNLFVLRRNRLSFTIDEQMIQFWI